MLQPLGEGENLILEAEANGQKLTKTKAEQYHFERITIAKI